MCGIAGLVGLSKTHDGATLRRIVSAMIHELIHRGPDGSGIWADSSEGVVLGHRRLAIQDLSELGDQPMTSAIGRYVISFNGEIYNFKVLRSELVSAGHAFRGGSDTEVILAAVEAWGLGSMLQRLNGMFAFALWDRVESTLTLARDRLGEKPLYWGVLKNHLCFASELKALRPIPDWEPEVDPNMLAAYFRYGYVPTPYSIVRSIFKLPPGCYISIPLERLRAGVRCNPLPDNASQDIRPIAYWNLSQEIEHAKSSPIADPEIALATLDDHLKTAVKLQLIADVPVGAFLSGGIDSSLVVAMAQRHCEQPLKTFTIGFPDSSHDESQFATRVAAHLGTDHHTLPLTAQNMLDTVPILSRISDEPFGNPSQIPMYLLSKFAREQVTVCLSGDGGDELFAGYNRYLRTAQLWKLRQYLPSWSIGALSTALSKIPFGAVDSISDMLHRHYPQQRLIPPAMGLKMQKLSAALSKRTLDQSYLYLRSFWDTPLKLVPDADADMNINDNIGPLTGDFDFIDRAMYLDTLTYLPDDGLTKIDRAAMAVSLETRLPLLDPSIVSYAWRLPVALKIYQNQPKWVLKTLLANYLPTDLIDRPKMGFTVPISQWLRGPLKEWAWSTLIADTARRADGLNGPEFARIWQEHQEKKRDHGLILWAALNYSEWRRTFATA